MSMWLDLNRIRAGVEHVVRRLAPAEFAGDDQFRVVAPVDLDVEVTKDARKVRLTGRVKTTIATDCSRCLEPFEILVDAPIDSIFLPAAENVAGDDEQVASEDLGVSYYREDVIDLGEVVREQCYLALPMKPLCRADCLGLCPVCGINRNRESCTCQVEWVDPRLDALRQLKGHFQ
ncbi:MAG: DUF177 domain-containing protein [Acidobacteria bacterium]|nr:DUF177 domain-containing protein [Acidobacteriota bacterium]